MSMKKKYKLGNHNGLECSRIYIQNKTLAEFGFKPGSVFVCEQDGEDFLLRLVVLEDDDIVWGEPHTVCYKEKQGVSVIDISGHWVRDIFEGYTHYTLDYEQGVIKVGGANE